jgi:hypothetical protein
VRRAGTKDLHPVVGLEDVAHLGEPRLSIDECRALLGSDCSMPDPYVAALRDQLYALADLVLVQQPSEAPDEEDQSR